MDLYDKMRYRYANTFHHMVNYGIRKNKDSRQLRVASVLLVSSASKNLRSFLSYYTEDDFKEAAVMPKSQIKKNIKDVQDYYEFLTNIGAITLSIVSFMTSEKNRRKDRDKNLLISFIKDFLSSLQYIISIDDSIKLKQKENLYSIFEHPSIVDITEEMISSTETKKVVEYLEKLDAKSIADKIKNAISVIKNKIKSAEQVSKMKIRNNVSKINPQEEVDFIAA